MGSLRIFLALSVLVGHVLGNRVGLFVQTDQAVTCFFVISGFYMSLVLSGKYEGRSRVWDFYSNRALRLYPTYYVVLLFAAFVSAATLSSLFGSDRSIFAHALTIISNITIFGSDWVFQFRPGAVLIISPIWSVGLELWFYILAPLFVRMSNGVLSTIMILSLALRAIMEARQPYSSYFFFPGQLGFFLLGIFAHRAWLSQWFRQLDFRVCLVSAVAGTGLILARNYLPGYRNHDWMLYSVTVMTIPFLFSMTKSILWDREIGNLSYSIYLLHEPVTNLLLNRTAHRPLLLVLIVTILLAVVVYCVIERPIDAWRQRRAADHRIKTQRSAVEFG
jgi:peptidoglycan/LPS O-acetylase OafA/YrhL